MYVFGSLMFLCRKFAYIFFYYYCFVQVQSPTYESSFSIFPIQLNYSRFSVIQHICMQLYSIHIIAL